MYSVNVNDNKFNFEIVSEDLIWDSVEVESGRFNIIHHNKSYSAVIISADYETKSFVVRVDNNTFNLSVRDRFDLMAEKLGINVKSSKKANEIKAPMPGMVLSILVNEGQVVKMGESVLILEAMKMENVIKAPADCTVKHVKVKQGNAVEKNQVLIELA